jgi:hypothetical protein
MLQQTSHLLLGRHAGDVPARGPLVAGLGLGSRRLPRRHLGLQLPPLLSPQHSCAISTILEPVAPFRLQQDAHELLTDLVCPDLHNVIWDWQSEG